MHVMRLPFRGRRPEFPAVSDGAQTSRRVDRMQNKANLAEKGSASVMGSRGVAIRLMIARKAMAAAGDGRSLPPVRQTNPIWPVLGRRTRARDENKPNRPGLFEAGKFEIRSSESETGPKPKCPKRNGPLAGLARQTRPICHIGLHRRGRRVRGRLRDQGGRRQGSEIRAGDVSAVQNKPNLPRFWAENEDRFQNKANPGGGADGSGKPAACARSRLPRRRAGTPLLLMTTSPGGRARREEIRFTRYASAMSAPHKTKPI
jgi:hypothetical protein